MTFTIKDGPGRRPSEQMRQLFEQAVAQTKAFAQNTPLGALTINGKFSHYADPDTDTMWIGFAIGMRAADRVRAAEERTPSTKGGHDHG